MFGIYCRYLSCSLWQLLLSLEITHEKKVMSDKLFSELYEKNVSYRVDNKQGKATAFPSFVIYSFHDLVENMVLLTLAPLCPVS